MPSQYKYDLALVCRHDEKEKIDPPCTPHLLDTFHSATRRGSSPVLLSIPGIRSVSLYSLFSRQQSRQSLLHWQRVSSDQIYLHPPMKTPPFYTCPLVILCMWERFACTIFQILYKFFRNNFPMIFTWANFSSFWVFTPIELTFSCFRIVLYWHKNYTRISFFSYLFF